MDDLVETFADALGQRDQTLLDERILDALHEHTDAEINEALNIALQGQDVETLQWWRAPCNCHGQLN